MNAGIVVLVIGTWLTGRGFTADVPDIGTVITLGGVVLLAWIWWRERVPT